MKAIVDQDLRVFARINLDNSISNVNFFTCYSTHKFDLLLLQRENLYFIVVTDLGVRTI